MPLSRHSRWLLLGGAAFAVTSAVYSVPQPAQPKIDYRTPARTVGVTTCDRCHRGATQRDREDGSTDFVRLDESTIWDNEDLHKRASEALDESKNRLAAGMAKILGGKLSQRVDCLVCHAVDKAPLIPLKDKTLANFYTRDGVSCESCHGFADLWNDPHYRSDSEGNRTVFRWRSLEPAKKEEYGQWDMRNPARRTERCSSCHVGNAEDGRFVTHEMYAAGHPPLPPLEVMTFSRDQPMHYKWAKDLPYFQTLDPTKAWDLFHYRKGESQPARLVAVGAIGTFRSAVRMLGQAADEAHSRNGLLDFAHFDCAACHHDLKLPSWRQQRGYAGAPGRPLPNTGPLALLRVVLDHAAGVAPALKPLADEFATKHAQLVKAFDARPFGDPAAIANATRELATWADSAEKGVNAVVYTPEEARKLLTVMAAVAAAPATGPSPGLDFDSAQQLYWAFQVLRDECPDLPAAVRTEGESLGNSLIIGRLKGTDQPRPFISDEQKGPLKERLMRAANYDPAAFRAAFTRISAALR
jgi:Cytochrome c554 and c-prime